MEPRFLSQTKPLVYAALGIALARKWGSQVPATVPVDITLIDQAKAKDFSW